MGLDFKKIGGWVEKNLPTILAIISAFRSNKTK